VKLDWDALKDQDFEGLCYDLLDREGFSDIKWIGRGGKDRGRDIICKKVEFIVGNVQRMMTYSVQCKKYIARPPSPSDFMNTIAWADMHKPNFLLIMVSNTLSAKTHDWLSGIAKSKRYIISTFEEKDFERFFQENEDIYGKYFERKEKEAPYKIDYYDIDNRVLMCLVDRSKKNIQEISKEVNIAVPEIEPILKRLLSKKVLICSKEKKEHEKALYSLRGDLTAFVNVAKELLLTDHKFDFLTSRFSIDMINRDFINYIESRHFLNLTAQVKNGLIIFFKLSPSALYYSLFSDARIYETGHHHLQSLKMPKEEREKWANSIANSFISRLMEKVLVDLHHPGSQKTLQQNKIEGYRLNIGLKMASIKDLIIDLSSESVMMFFKAKGEIKAGSLVSTTSPELFVRIGEILTNLRLLEQAIKQYDLTIDQVKDAEHLKVAWNNKGVCLMRLNRWSDAVPCFNEALKIDPNLKEAQKNRKKCLDKLRSSRTS